MVNFIMQKCLNRYRQLMDDVKYPTKTEEDMSKIHEEHKIQVMQDFREAAKSLNKAPLYRELEVGFGCMIHMSFSSCFNYVYSIVKIVVDNGTIVTNICIYLCYRLN